MSNDISPTLLRVIIKDFKRYCNSSRRLLDIMKKIEKGTATQSDMYDYAAKIGECLSKAYKKHLTSKTLPNGRMYWNIAKSVVGPTLTNNYTLVNNTAIQIQKLINESNNIGINPLKSTLNTDRVDGFMNKMANADNFDDVAYLLNEPIVNFTLSVVDDFIRENAKFHYDSGLKTQIIRISAHKCCKWCSKLAGTYDYEQVSNKGNDVFRRHENCRCTVLFKSDKYMQNVHSKKEYSKDELKELVKTHQLNYKKSTKIKTHLPKNVEDITSYYLNELKLGKGNVIIEKGVDIKSHQDEINTAKWLKEKFGGEIKILAEQTIEGAVTPDFLWNGIPLELKTMNSIKSIDKSK